MENPDTSASPKSRRTGRRRRSEEKGEIRVDPTGFDVIDVEGPPVRVDWSDVRGIAAFKRDTFAVDLICLAFRRSDGHTHAYVDEEMPGYQALVDEIQQRYPDHAPRWWMDTAFPAFAACWTVIWGDAPEPAECPKCNAEITGCSQDACPQCAAPLATIPCPDCRGRGETREWWWKWVAALGVAAGATLLGLGYARNADAGADGSALFKWAWPLLAGAALSAFFAIRARPWPCTRCEHTGWWDPRGRAARRIPPKT